MHQLIETCPLAFYPDTSPQQPTEQSDYLDIVMFDLMKLCNSDSKVLRVGASVLLYKLLKANLVHNDSTLRFKVRASISISKIIGLQENNYTPLFECLNHIKKISTEDDLPETYITHIRQVVLHMETLMQQTELVRRNSSDPEMLAALYHKISNGFTHSPKLRLTWLNNLTELHVKMGNKTEAGQCKMSMAAIVVRYLRATAMLKRVPPYFEFLFDSIAPHVNVLHLMTPSPNEASDPTQVFKGDTWSLSQLIEVLEEAAKLFEESTFFELCLEVYSLLSLVYKSERKYINLVTTLDAHKALLMKMTDPEKLPDRLVPVYFRIAFYGKRWDEELRGKQFIYKKDVKFNLSVMIKQMEEQFSTRYGKGNVVVLSKNKSIEELQKTMEEDKVYIQIAGVVPYVGPEESNLRVTFFDLNFNIDKFLFETSFAEAGTKIDENDLNSIRKKKTIYKTRFPFPYVENRVEVISTEQHILSPIQNAIELITQQTAKVQQQLEAVPTRVNLLQQTLQGSVVPMVNPGPIRVCETFLSPNTIKEGRYPKEDTHRLTTAMEMFVKKCCFAVKLNQYVMDEKHVKFTEMIERSFAQLEATVKNAVEEARVVLAMVEG